LLGKAVWERLAGKSLMEEELGKKNSGGRTLEEELDGRSPC
jgi:hypothetical protein